MTSLPESWFRINNEIVNQLPNFTIDDLIELNTLISNKWSNLTLEDNKFINLYNKLMDAFHKVAPIPKNIVLYRLTVHHHKLGTEFIESGFGLKTDYKQAEPLFKSIQKWYGFHEVHRKSDFAVLIIEYPRKHKLLWIDTLKIFITYPNERLKVDHIDDNQITCHFINYAPHTNPLQAPKSSLQIAKSTPSNLTSVPLKVPSIPSRTPNPAITVAPSNLTSLKVPSIPARTPKPTITVAPSNLTSLKVPSIHARNPKPTITVAESNLGLKLRGQSIGGEVSGRNQNKRECSGRVIPGARGVNGMTIEEMKQFLKKQGLSSRGNRVELCNRILDHNLAII